MSVLVLPVDGTTSTYSELKTNIANWLNRDDLTGVIDEFIDLAEARFRREIRNYKMEETATLTATGRYTALPPDFLQPIRVYNATRSRPLEPASREYIQSQRYAVDDATGAPRFYAITDRQIELFPTPADSTDIELLYYEQIPALSDAQETNWLLTEAPDIYLYGALIHSAPYLVDDARTQTWAAMYQSAVDELHMASENAKWGGPLNLRPAKGSSY